MKIQNNSIDFKADRIDQLESVHNDDVDGAWQTNKNALQELNKQFAIMQNIAARRVLNKTFSKYSNDLRVD